MNDIVIFVDWRASWWRGSGGLRLGKGTHGKECTMDNFHLKKNVL